MQWMKQRAVLCMDYQETFKSEEDYDNHNCPAHAKEEKNNDVEDTKPKMEPPENGECSSNGKRSPRSRIKKEPL